MVDWASVDLGARLGGVLRRGFSLGKRRGVSAYRRGNSNSEVCYCCTRTRNILGLSLALGVKSFEW